MEKVFWLMWLADIVGSIGVVGAIACLGVVVLLVISAMVSAADGDTEFVRLAVATRQVKWLLIPVAVALVTPSAKTIHVLTLATAADAAASTALGAKGLEALNAVLDGVIAKAKK